MNGGAARETFSPRPSGRTHTLHEHGFWIKIHGENVRAAQGQRRCDIHYRRRFAAPTLKVEKGNDLRHRGKGFLFTRVQKLGMPLRATLQTFEVGDAKHRMRPSKVLQLHAKRCDKFGQSLLVAVIAALPTAKIGGNTLDHESFVRMLPTAVEKIIY